MAGLVLNSIAVLRLNICAKLNICASISATSPSCKPKSWKPSWDKGGEKPEQKTEKPEQKEGDGGMKLMIGDGEGGTKSVDYKSGK